MVWIEGGSSPHCKNSLGTSPTHLQYPLVLCGSSSGQHTRGAGDLVAKLQPLENLAMSRLNNCTDFHRRREGTDGAVGPVKPVDALKQKPCTKV